MEDLEESNRQLLSARNQMESDRYSRMFLVLNLLLKGRIHMIFSAILMRPVSITIRILFTWWENPQILGIYHWALTG